MAWNVSCPKCGKRYRVGEDKAGRKVRCRGCGTAIRVPESRATSSSSDVSVPLSLFYVNKRRIGRRRRRRVRLDRALHQLDRRHFGVFGGRPVSRDDGKTRPERPNGPAIERILVPHKDGVVVGEFDFLARLDRFTPCELVAFVDGVDAFLEERALGKTVGFQQVAGEAAADD